MTAPPIAQSEPAAVPPKVDLAAAHREMLADTSLQFQFHEFTPPDPPSWIEPLLRALSAAAPFVSYIFWGCVILTVLVLVYLVGSEILRRLPDRAREKTPAEQQPKPEYRPAPARARALLEEADRLAAQGRYSEAVRVLLHRSIEDLERMFALMIGPGLTSREIAALEPHVHALVMVNCISATVVGPDGKPFFAGERRGIAGAAIRGACVEQVRLFARLIKARRSPLRLVGVGGISTAEHVGDFLRAGAHAVQLATAVMRDPAVGLAIRRAHLGTARSV